MSLSKFLSPASRGKFARGALFVLLTFCAGAIAAGSSTAFGAALETAVAELEAAAPSDGAGFERVSLARLAHAAENVENAATASLAATQSSGPSGAIAAADQFLTAKQRVDRRLDALFALGPQAAKTAVAQADKPREREILRNYLRATNQLIDLSGRLRHMSFDVLRNAGASVASYSNERRQLIDMLLRHKSDVGAITAAKMLLDPAGGQSMGSDPALQYRALQLIAAAGESEVLPQLAAFVQRLPGSWLTVAAAETIRSIGLPQDVRPGQDPTLEASAITAAQLRVALARVSPRSLTASWEARRQSLLTWLDARIAHGVPEDAALSVGCCQVKAGDWLLMRNPSPYNLFTDLSPGLFTHVGVVAWEKGSDGRGRLVLVDLPERGTSIPATNVETFLKRTRHYVFLRHDDPEVARQMAAAAAAMIGNPAEFDLNFRTDRVLALNGQPLAGKKIHTYCAGLLLLCALHTDRAREEFFPISEGCAGGLTAENLAVLGMSVGDNFVSPSGALFSESLKMVGRKQPSYDPQREIEESLYDYFAAKLITTKLNVSNNMFQSLRLKVATASKGNKLLAEALAHAAGVSAEMDLVSAARAAAVVETLDEIAYGASGQYTTALAAIKDQPIPGGAAAAAQAQRDRQIHASLISRWRQNQIHPRMLRIELIRYYKLVGRQGIDQRFFLAPQSRR